jgi:hypothetical protein
MITSRWCALCGADYVEEVAVCTTCLVALVDRRPLRPDEVGDKGDPQLGYDYAAATNEQRLAIDELLEADGIDHAWDGTALVVRTSDEAAVDALLDEAGAEAVADNGPPVAEWLDEDADVLVYDLSDWDHDQRSDLVAELAGRSVDHLFDDDGDLVVGTDAEAVVDEIIDGIDFPDQLPVDDGADDGDAAAGAGAEAGSLAEVETMSALFLAADRLVHDPDDSAAIIAMDDAAAVVEGTRPPYGFSPGAWTAIQTQAAAVMTTLEDPDAAPDQVIEAATTLRATLRPLV